MDDQQVGIASRTIRVRRRLRQTDLAATSGVSRSTIVRVERGRLETVPLGMIRRVAAALDARFDTTVRWQGGDLGRLVSARRAAMHEVIARVFANHREWLAEPEVWLREPDGKLDALGFLPSVSAANVRRDLTPIRRVNRSPAARPRA